MSKTEVMATFTNLGLEPARYTYHSADLGEDPIGQYQAVLEEAMELTQQIEQLKKTCVRTALGLDADMEILPSSKQISPREESGSPAATNDVKHPTALEGGSEQARSASVVPEEPPKQL